MYDILVYPRNVRLANNPAYYASTTLSLFLSPVRFPLYCWRTRLVISVKSNRYCLSYRIFFGIVGPKYTEGRNTDKGKSNEMRQWYSYKWKSHLPLYRMYFSEIIVICSDVWMALNACPTLSIILGNAWYESTSLRHHCSYRCPSSLQLPHWLDSKISVKWTMLHNSHTHAQPLDRPCPRESGRSKTRYCSTCFVLFLLLFTSHCLFVSLLLGSFL